MHQSENVWHIPSSAFNRVDLLRFMVVSLFMLLVIDIVLTYVGVVYLNGIEWNPLCASLGLNAFIALKIALALALPLAIYYIGREHVLLGGTCVGSLNVLYAAIAVNNVIVLGLVG